MWLLANLIGNVTIEIKFKKPTTQKVVGNFLGRVFENHLMSVIMFSKIKNKLPTISSGKF